MADDLSKCRARVAELEALFDLQRTRMAPATEAWQAATGRHGTLPDLGRLLDWLLGERKRLNDFRLRSEVREKALREEVNAQCYRVEELKASVAELLDTLQDVLNQACGDNADNVDSGALSVYADGLRLLAREGRFKITREAGRRVIGYWLPRKETFDE
jgi:hypothetical protein